MNMNASSHCRKGFVLISVLMLGTLLLAAATALTWFARSMAKSIAGKRAQLEARSFARVVTDSVVALIAGLGEHTDYDSPTQKWYQPVAVSMGEGEFCIVKVTPLDDKIPIRSLFLPDNNTLRNEFKDVWADMWEKLGRKELGDVVLDLMDKNDKPRVGSTELKGWLNRPVYDLGELMVLSDEITPEMFSRLENYVTLWSDGHINLNTAPLQVLELLPGLDIYGLAERLVSYRADTPLQSISDVEKLPGATAKTTSRLNNIATVKSRYIEVKITTEALTFRAIVDRTTKNILLWEEL
ncbi:MAG: general secretion pathway protein GspK [Synergistaceae bacterium]|nr:general secretion pathway protein GspK [Synergistaceae bacterium]